MIQNYEIFQPEHYHGTFPSWKPCRTPTAKASWMLWSTAPSLRSACQKPQMNKWWIEGLGLVLYINHDLAIHKIDQNWGILNSPTNMRMYQTQPDFFFKWDDTVVISWYGTRGIISTIIVLPVHVCFEHQNKVMIELLSAGLKQCIWCVLLH